MLELHTVIDSHTQNYNSQLYTSMPARVLEVTAGEGIQYVRVQPSINKIYTDGVAVQVPEVNRVPVVFPSGGGGLLSFPIAVDDTVLLVFSQRNVKNWLAGDGSEVNPETLRTHSLNDAIAIPGLYPFDNNLTPNPRDVELKYNDSTILLKQDGGIEVLTTSGDLNASSSGNTHISSDGTITVSTGSTISISNGNEELVSILSELVEAISQITTSTVYSPQQPINNLADFTSLKARLDTFLE